MQKHEELNSAALDLERQWSEAPKHELVVPYRLLAEHDEGSRLLEMARYQLSGSEISDSAVPLSECDRGIAYTAATVSSHALLKGPRTSRGKYLGVSELERLADRDNPVWIDSVDTTPNRLEGKPGETFYRVKRPEPGLCDENAGGFKQYVLPFVFTDFEPDLYREEFRNITTAGLLEETFGGGSRTGLTLQSMLAEDLGLSAEYREWRDELADKTPFKDAKIIDSLERKYGGLTLLEDYK